MTVLHRRDASFKVLHWPKLFEGWMLAGKYRHYGDGELTGDGLGGSYPRGAIARRGDGLGDGNGNGNGNGNGYGRGYGYGSGNGNGSSKRSV